jgi:membrane protease YdiL (CAAX protease family)
LWTPESGRHQPCAALTSISGGHKSAFNLEATIGLRIAGLVLQAVAFGALHVTGFPRGWVGVALATIYGLMMGAVRRRSGGMLAPWIAHVLTDVVIVGIILTFERPSVAAPATAAAWRVLH